MMTTSEEWLENNRQQFTSTKSMRGMRLGWGPRKHTLYAKRAAYVQRISVPADGYCFFHALRKMLEGVAGIGGLSVDDVYQQVIREFQENPDAYSGFLEGNASYSKTLDDFVRSGSGGWRTALGNVVPLAAANAFGAVIVVHNSHTQPIVLLPREAHIGEPLEVLLVGDHYWALETRGLEESGQGSRRNGKRNRTAAFGNGIGIY
jgi:hypothetical protein